MSAARPQDVLAKRLKELIPDGELTRSAVRAGLSMEHLLRLRQGKHTDVKLSTLAALAGALRVSMSSLIADSHGAGLAAEVKATYGSAGAADDHETLPLAEGLVGGGSASLEPGDKARRYAFHREWLRRDAKARHLIAVRVAKGSKGKDMLPTIGPGSILVVDRGPAGDGIRELQRSDQGKLYVVRLPEDDGLYVKRVYRSVDALALWSDNPDAHPRLLLVALKGHRLQDLLLGRVRWIGREID
jgi:DNA-binding Xre family transcriptional regulator